MQAKLIKTLAIALITMANALTASTTTYSGSFGPGPSVTYIETVGPATTNSMGNPVPPNEMDTSTPCTTLSTSGCSLGSFSVPFSPILVPAGNYVQSASLDLHYQFNGSTSSAPPTVTPININAPSTAGTAGSHFEEFYFTFNTAAGSFNQPTAPFSGNYNMTGISYTAAVQSADVGGTISLAPIGVSNGLLYGSKTAQSASGGLNSNTMFYTTFDLANASLDAVLTVNFAPIPEPACYELVAAGSLILIGWRHWALPRN